LKKVSLIWSLVCFVSCFSVEKKTEVKAVYDELALTQFVQLSATQNQETSLRLSDSAMTVASNDSTVFHKTINYLAKIYSNPNSSFRNEVFYDKILKAQMDSKWYTAMDKQEVLYRLHLLHQNDVGDLANDFEYRTPGGQKNSMFNLEADYLLLFFYNPECEACKEMTQALKHSSFIEKVTATGRLKIFCVYTDMDLSAWYRHLHEYPSLWIQGRDQDEYLYKHDIYDLRAIPTLYLLNRNKKVILKDCIAVEELERNIH